MNNNTKYLRRRQRDEYEDGQKQHKHLNRDTFFNLTKYLDPIVFHNVVVNGRTVIRDRRINNIILVNRNVRDEHMKYYVNVRTVTLYHCVNLTNIDILLRSPHVKKIVIERRYASHLMERYTNNKDNELYALYKNKVTHNISPNHKRKILLGLLTNHKPVLYHNFTRSDVHLLDDQWLVKLSHCRNFLAPFFRNINKNIVILSLHFEIREDFFAAAEPENHPLLNMPNLRRLQLENIEVDLDLYNVLNILEERGVIVISEQYDEKN